ncbi:unnamed protein product [Vicia faba]|uniref:F-box domain-containing protein n=1 Tax=Vicia faba TaxID=3906 RepID=A0AAV1AXH7_VICFA|nr:unnamed protein product [Vicia faba]
MGQAASTAAVVNRRERHTNTAKTTRSTSLVSPMNATGEDDEDIIDPVNRGISDYISDLPDECLAIVFQSLSPGDRNQCSLVCRRWLTVEGQSRQRLSLNAKLDLLPMISSLFNRFDSVTKLALKCDLIGYYIGGNSNRCNRLLFFFKYVLGYYIGGESEPM